MEPELWIAAGAAIGSAFIALNSFAVWSYSRAKLEDTFTGKGGRKRLETFETHLEGIQLALSVSKALMNLILLTSLLVYFTNYGENFTLIQIALAMATSLSVLALFSIAIPRVWGTVAGEDILAKTAPILIGFRYLLWPITAILQAVDIPVRRLLGRDETGLEHAEEEAKQEILQVAADGAAEGAVDADEMEMIESVMEFGDTDAGEIMTPRTDMFALSADATWAEAIQQIHEQGHTRIPIYQDNIDNITGVLYAKDLLQFINTTPPKSLTDIARKPFFVPDSKPLDDLLREFKARKVHLAIVLDEYGGTAGLVSIEDVIEEIVGEISDEYDEFEASQIKRISEMTLEVDGRLRVDELNDELELELPEDEDFDTVAGFAVSQLGYIPANNETFAAAGAEFTILVADERKISRLKVTKLPEEQPQE